MQGDEPRGNDWWTQAKPYLIYLVPALLIILWLQAEFRAWNLRSQISRLHAVSMVVQAIDAETKDPLRIVVQAPPTRGTWPKAFSTESIETSRMRLAWIGIDAVSIGVSAEGYQQVTLQLDEHSPSTITVPLRRPAER